MREFECGAIVPGCSTIFDGESDSAILNQVAAHARDDHGMDEVPPEIVDTILESIREKVSV